MHTAAYFWSLKKMITNMTLNPHTSDTQFFLIDLIWTYLSLHNQDKHDWSVIQSLVELSFEMTTLLLVGWLLKMWGRASASDSAQSILAFKATFVSGWLLNGPPPSVPCSPRSNSQYHHECTSSDSTNPLWCGRSTLAVKYKDVLG